jgi:hypothetical protein
MKFKGEQLQNNFVAERVLRFNNELAVTFKVRALTSEESKEADDLYDLPEPPTITLKGGKKMKDRNDPDYLKAVTEMGERKFNYFLIKGLTATEDLEFEDVDVEDPDTYDMLDEEFKKAGITSVMKLKLIEAALEANQISDAAIKAAEQDFLPLHQDNPEK